MEKMGTMGCNVKDGEVENGEQVTECVGEAYKWAELRTRNH